MSWGGPGCFGQKQFRHTATDVSAQDVSAHSDRTSTIAETDVSALPRLQCAETVFGRNIRLPAGARPPPPPMEPNAHRSRSISDVSSFNTVSVLNLYHICLRALCVEEPKLGCISSVVSLSLNQHKHLTCVCLSDTEVRRCSCIPW